MRLRAFYGVPVAACPHPHLISVIQIYMYLRNFSFIGNQLVDDSERQNISRIGENNEKVVKILA